MASSAEQASGQNEARYVGDFSIILSGILSLTRVLYSALTLESPLHMDQPWHSESSAESPGVSPATQDNVEDSEDEEFVYPSNAEGQGQASQTPPARQVHPSPAQLESLYAAALSGDLPLLQRLFRTALQNGEIEPFSLSNDASTRTGLTALHAAASRGYYDMTVWCTPPLVWFDKVLTDASSQ